jgi:hypothetical protein
MRHWEKNRRELLCPNSSWSGKTCSLRWVCYGARTAHSGLYLRTGILFCLPQVILKLGA